MDGVENAIAEANNAAMELHEALHTAGVLMDTVSRDETPKDPPGAGAPPMLARLMGQQCAINLLTRRLRALRESLAF